MKTLKLLPAMLVLLSLFIGCNNENITTSSKIEVKAQPIGKQSAANALKSETNTNTESQTVFTSDEFVSYNAKTGEIILKNNLANENPLSILKNYSDKLEFYKDGKLLFALKSKIVSDIESALYNEPVLHYSSLEENKCFIRDGYPGGIPIGSIDQRDKQSERYINAEKILSGWKIFIEELKKEGKYIEK